MKSLPLVLAFALISILAWRAGGTAEETRLLSVAAAGAVFVLAAVLSAVGPAVPAGRDGSLLIPLFLCLAAAIGVAASPAPAVARPGGREIAAAALLLSSLVILAPPPRALTVFAGALAVWAVALVACGLLRGAPLPLRSTFVNRNHFCAFLGIIFPLAFAPALGPGRKDARARWALLSVVVAGGMALTRSRGGLAALLATLLFFWGWERQRRGWRLLPVFMAGSLVIILLAALFATTAGIPLPHPLSSILHPPSSTLYPPSPTLYPPSSTEISVSTRISLMESTAALFLARPVFGWGWGSFPFLYPRFKAPGVWYTVTHAHNEWLETAAESGIVGLALIASALILLFRRTLGAAATTGAGGSLFARGAAGSMVYALVHSNFEFIFRVPAIGFLLAAIGGVALSIGDSARKEEAQPSKGAGRGWRMEGRGWRRRAGLLAAAAGAVVFLILPSARGYLSGRAAAGGFLLLEKGLVDPAAACFSRAHDLDRSAHPPLYGLARAEMARFHRAAARTEAYARIEKLLEQAGAGNPWDVRTEWTRAAFLSRLGDLAGAESALRRAQGLDPSNPFFSLELARLRLSLRDPRGAAALLRQASETYPPIWPAALSLLVSRVENGAILRELAPRGATFRRDLVYALLAARRTAEGREEAERAARNDPDDGDSWLALGRAAAADGRTGEARDAYRRSLALDPDNGTVWAELGGLHLRRGEDEEGLRCFLTAVGFSPTALGPARSAGALLLSRRGAEAALGYWDSLSRRAPEWGYPHFARAEIRLGMNDRKGASSDLAKALEREPENPRFLALLRRLQP